MTTCQYNGCNRRLRKVAYFMGWQNGGIVQRGLVCASHDRYLGRINIARWKHISMGEAVAWDNEWLLECRREP